MVFGNNGNNGKRHSNAQVCGVSILRPGEAMEPALCEIC